MCDFYDTLLFGLFEENIWRFVKSGRYVNHIHHKGEHGKLVDMNLDLPSKRVTFFFPYDVHPERLDLKT